MYTYTARVGSSCQHIRTSCRQCATSRLRSIAPRLPPRSLSPNILLATRSYASSADSLEAWLASVKNKKKSAEGKKRPADSQKESEQNPMSLTARAQAKSLRKELRKPFKKYKLEDSNEHFVEALQIIADAYGIPTHTQSADKPDGPEELKEKQANTPQAGTKEIYNLLEEKRAKTPQDGTKEIYNLLASRGKNPSRTKNVVEREAEALDIHPSALAAALGVHHTRATNASNIPIPPLNPNQLAPRGHHSPTRPQIIPVPTTNSAAQPEKADGSAPAVAPSVTPKQTKKVERRKMLRKKRALKKDSSLGAVFADKGWMGVVDKALNIKEPPQPQGVASDMERKEGPIRRVLVATTPIPKSAFIKERERPRFVGSSRVAKAPLTIHRPLTRGREPSSQTGSVIRRTGPLLQRLYKITHSVATTQAQRLLLQFLEKNHDLLGEHKDALLDAERDLALFTPPTASSGAGNAKLESTLLATYQSLEEALKPKPSAPEPKIPKMNLSKKDSALGEINASDLELKPIDVPQPPVPGVVYGLDRVLFNPGVYQLRDEHSKVYNFDPYLETITPVREFDFSALKEYITSSRDTALISIASREKTKYTGSTSSMTSALAHFHYLLSKWRPINMNHLSRGFPDPLTSFSSFQRDPTGIFLRWRDGVYAIDANKEFDTANVLMYLGKSMEKFLTEEKEVYEKFRKDQSHTLSPEDKDTPESYHYTTMGDFLMRSQLDAYDPRLPGTGMFDLKTRAVVSIRKDATDFEPGLGYEIRKRKGEFESFEREYYDLCRAAFMKYSLQARMGRMDGIFVAYHNIERIFGFQYLPIGAMDEAIHGTTDTTLGDQEFKVSVSMLNKALDMFTEKFPAQSLQIDIETRPLNASKDDCFMYIIAQPVTEEKIKSIQESNLGKIQEYERQVVGLDSKQTAQFLIDAVNKETEDAELMDDAERLENAIERPFEPRNVEILKAAVEKMNEHDTATENAVHKALEMVEARLQEEGEIAMPAEDAEESANSTEEPLAETSDPEARATEEATATAEESSTSSSAKVEKSAKASIESQNPPMMGLKLQVRNFVNGQEVFRVENFSASDTWEVKYGIELMTYEAASKRHKQMKDRKALHNGSRKKSPNNVKAGSANKYQDQFLSSINNAVQAGKQYRAHQDALDAARGIKSLADTETAFEPVKADEIEIRSGGLKVEDTEKPKVAEEVIFTEDAQKPLTEAPKEEAKVEAKIETKTEQPKEEAESEAPKEESKPAAEKPWWLL